MTLLFFIFLDNVIVAVRTTTYINYAPKRNAARYGTVRFNAEWHASHLRRAYIACPVRYTHCIHHTLQPSHLVARGACKHATVLKSDASPLPSC